MTPNKLSTFDKYLLTTVVLILIMFFAVKSCEAADTNSIYHFGGSAAISGVLVTGGATKTQAILVTSGIGLVKELGDSKVSGEDLAANLGGAVFGAFAAEYLTFRW